MNIDFEKLIDFDKIRDVLEKNKDKEIYVFGGGSAATILYKNLLCEYQILSFLDNNSKMWGQSICDVKIESPETIICKKEVCILIISKYVEAISKQLEEYGFCKNVDFFDIYEMNIKYFRMKKFDEMSAKFEQFIQRVPKACLQSTIRNSEKIAVICMATTVDNETWYSFTEFILLRCLGYNVTLIVDNLRGYDDAVYFNDSYKLVEEYTDYMCELLRKKCSELDIIKLSEDYRDMSLTQEDVNEVRKYAKVNAIWQNSKEEMKQIPNTVREDLFFVILKNNLKKIKALFCDYKFDTIHIITALHKSRGLYLYIGKKHNMRVSSYDGSDNSIFCSSDYSSLHLYDMRKMLDDTWFSKKEYKEIVKLGKNKFEHIRRAQEICEAGCNMKLPQGMVDNVRFQKPDVVIPLNIEWDGAALGIDRIFSSYFEWLFETVDYILKNTDANILIREHPAVSVCPNNVCFDYNEIFEKLYRDEERIYICKYDEEVNTYAIIENCKVVLPYSSTVGLEAAVMGKTVITQSDCYYNGMEFVYTAKDKEDYFDLVQKGLSGELTIDVHKQEQAAYIYFCRLNCAVNSNFREINLDWMESSIEELLNEQGVRDYCKVIAEGVTPSFINVSRILKDIS